MIFSINFYAKKEIRSRPIRIYCFQVQRKGEMTTKMCEKCFDKINDFATFREICVATDIQLKIIMGLRNYNGDANDDSSDVPVAVTKVLIERTNSNDVDLPLIDNGDEETAMNRGSDISRSIQTEL